MPSTLTLSHTWVTKSIISLYNGGSYRITNHTCIHMAGMNVSWLFVQRNFICTFHDI